MARGFQPQAVSGTSKTVIDERLKAPPQTWDRATLSNSLADSPENVPAFS